MSDLYSNRVNAHIFEALLGYDPLAIPVRQVPLTAEAMPEVSADFSVWTVAHQARHRVRRRPGVQGQAARARRGGLRVCLQAHLRPRLQEPGVHHARRGRHPRPRGDPRARAARQEALRLRQRRRGAARARPLHAAVQARQAAAALHVDARLEHVCGGGARGRRGLSRRPDGPSGRDRAISAQGVAPQLAQRPREEPGISRRSLPERARSGRSRGDRLGQAPQWSAPAAQRRRRDRRRSGEPAALAELSQRPGRLRARSARAVADRRAEREDRAESRQARHPAAAVPEFGRHSHVLQHGRPDGRRLRAGEGRAAPRGPARVRH